ncbi:MAG: 16S rRNA (guanine(527)-N(7))-methyltransferase RsmG [Nitrospirota bacterium]
MEPADLLRKGLDQLDLPSSPSLVCAFMTYLAELKKWNKTYNLTGLRTDEDIVIKHFLDSLLYLKVMPEEAASIADVGTGAGFPGLPIKIMRPEIVLYLIESSGKKCAFLRHITRRLEIESAFIIEKRVENIRSAQEMTAVDAAVTRALFTVNEFLEKASHVVRPGGFLVLSKGPKVTEELKALGDVKSEVTVFKLPLTDIKRFLVVLKL